MFDLKLKCLLFWKKKKKKLLRKLTNSECRSLEIPCILAECWMTRSNRSARETTWHPAWALVQMGAALTLVSLVQNTRQTNTTHTADTRRDQRLKHEQRMQKKICMFLKTLQNKKNIWMNLTGWNNQDNIISEWWAGRRWNGMQKFRSCDSYLIWCFRASCRVQRSFCLSAEGAAASYEGPSVTFSLLHTSKKKSGRERERERQWGQGGVEHLRW